MSKVVGFTIRIGIMLLVFFSIQGEVVQRYMLLAHGDKDNHHIIDKKTVEHQQLHKLQCFTQRLQPVDVPSIPHFNFVVVVCLTKANRIFPADSNKPDPLSLSFPSLRGPPVIVC